MSDAYKAVRWVSGWAVVRESDGQVISGSPLAQVDAVVLAERLNVEVPPRPKGT